MSQQEVSFEGTVLVEEEVWIHVFGLKTDIQDLQNTKKDKKIKMNGTIRCTGGI